MRINVKEPNTSSPWSDISGLLLDVDHAFRNRPAELDFVLPGLVSGTVGTLVSPGGVGKSILALESAMSIAAGQDLFSLWSLNGRQPIHQGKVVIVAVEDPALVLQQRVHTLGLHLSEEDRQAISRNLQILPAFGLGFTITQIGEVGLQQSLVMAAFHKWLVACVEKPRLVVFDTLNRCLGGASENSSSDMSLVMTTVEQMCRSTGCAALIVHHANKAAATSGNGHSQFAIRGSSAITDNSRFQANLSVMSEASAKSRGITDEVERLKWVRFDVSKANYAPPIGALWLRRDQGGALWGALPPPELQVPDTAPAKSKTPRIFTADFSDTDFGGIQ